ncbi:MAG: chemotaxis protein CheW [Planctomycetia bacterium]|nr:chemotaxis protein CheW [Planctomycetia bacterium]
MIEKQVGNFPPTPSANASPAPLFLLIPLDHMVCALPASEVLEILRPLPVDSVPGSPAVVLGLSLIRGEPTPVLDLRRLLGAGPAPSGRFIVLRTDRRRVALAVEGVSGTERIPSEALDQAPPLVSRAAAEALEAIASLDGALLLVLRTARLIPESLPVPQA